MYSRTRLVVRAGQREDDGTGSSAAGIGHGGDDRHGFQDREPDRRDAGAAVICCDIDHPVAAGGGVAGYRDQASDLKRFDTRQGYGQVVAVGIEERTVVERYYRTEGPADLVVRTGEREGYRGVQVSRRDVHKRDRRPYLLRHRKPAG